MSETSAKAIAAVILPVCYIAVAAFHASAEVDQQVREPATRALRLVEQTSAKFLETRECFTCHTQTLSAMVLEDARKRGFESGFPHGKDHFISVFATGWATKALLLELGEEKTDDLVCRP
jgi:hypothetical protein